MNGSLFQPRIFITLRVVSCTLKLLFGLYFLFLTYPFVFGQNNNQTSSTNTPPDLTKYLDRKIFEDPYKNITESPLPPKKVREGASDPLISIDISDLIDHVMELHRNAVRKVGNHGYRVQIFLGNMAGAKEARILFVSRYESVDVYTIDDENSPFYKIRVGNFRSQKEAEAFMDEIKYEFPDASIVPDNIVIENEKK